MWSQITFNDHTATWYDSAVNTFNGLDGEIQTERGTCPVKFTINDGRIGFTFTTISTESNVLWFILDEGENSTVVDYTITNGIVSTGNSWEANQPTGPRFFNSCFVKLSNDGESVGFCSGGGSITPVGCMTYQRDN